MAVTVNSRTSRKLFCTRNTYFKTERQEEAGVGSSPHRSGPPLVHGRKCSKHHVGAEDVSVSLDFGKDLGVDIFLILWCQSD